MDEQKIQKKIAVSEFYTAVCDLLAHVVSQFCAMLFATYSI